MAKSKKIEEEVKEQEVKIQELEQETDTDTLNEEAESVSELTLNIYQKDYKVSELIALKHKTDKSYAEKEITNRFDELMLNYYRGIRHAILRDCCGQTYTLEAVKNKLKEKEAYDIIDRRCSRKDIRFNKETVETIIKYVEELEG